MTRDKEAALLRREEQEEIERRRALPEAQRLREDEEHARKTREEKEANRGERAFMEKFYHKGAFYQVCLVPMCLELRRIHAFGYQGGGYPEEELQCQDGKSGGCVVVAESYASPQFRQGEFPAR